MNRSSWVLLSVAAAAELVFIVYFLYDIQIGFVGLALLTLAPLLVVVSVLWRGLDGFSRGALVIAATIWGFLVWGGLHNPATLTDQKEEMRTIWVSSLLPLALIGTVVVMWFLQRGET